MCKCNCPDFKTHIGGITLQTRFSTERKDTRQMERNHQSYRDLKAEGFQPRSLGNADEIAARATDPREIAEGKIMSKEKIMQRNIVHEAMGEAGMLAPKAAS